MLRVLESGVTDSGFESLEFCSLAFQESGLGVFALGSRLYLEIHGT